MLVLNEPDECLKVGIRDKNLENMLKSWGENKQTYPNDTYKTYLSACKIGFMNTSYMQQIKWHFFCLLNCQACLSLKVNL